MDITTDTAPTEAPAEVVPVETKAEPAAETPHPLQEKVTRAMHNKEGALRRINTRMQGEINQLKERLASLEQYEDTPARAQLEDRLTAQLDTYQAIEADRAHDDFYGRVVSTFGDDSETFMNQTYEYAEYVNQNEPELLKIMQRPLGLLVLEQWYNRMDNPTTRQQWLGMTAYEKGAVLTNFYREFEQLTAAKPPVKGAAPVRGGRDTNNTPPLDDFGGHLQAALNKWRK